MCSSPAISRQLATEAATRPTGRATQVTQRRGTQRATTLPPPPHLLLPPSLVRASLVIGRAVASSSPPITPTPASARGRISRLPRQLAADSLVRLPTTRLKKNFVRIAWDHFRIGRPAPMAPKAGTTRTPEPSSARETFVRTNTTPNGNATAEPGASGTGPIGPPVQTVFTTEISRTQFLRKTVGVTVKTLTTREKTKRAVSLVWGSGAIGLLVQTERRIAGTTGGRGG